MLQITCRATTISNFGSYDIWPQVSGEASIDLKINQWPDIYDHYTSPSGLCEN